MEIVMESPVNTLVAAIVSLLDASLLEEYEERAAIVQFDGKVDRREAECLALIDVLHRHKLKIVIRN
jgi:hypothetical protein